MGRTKYTDDKRKSMLLMFIQTTRTIIDSDGIENLTIRKIAKASGYNSATIYLYFHDLDELVCLAALSYVEDLIREWVEFQSTEHSSFDTYCMSWRIFAKYAFKNPQIYNHLFFFPHARPFDETVRTYHRLFPERLEDIGDVLEEILLGSPHIERESSVLLPMAKEGIIKEENLEMISALAAAYFRRLLDKKCQFGDSVDDEQLIEDQIAVVHFLLNSQ